jgi:hypothetical protein
MSQLKDGACRHTQAQRVSNANSSSREMSRSTPNSSGKPRRIPKDIKIVPMSPINSIFSTEDGLSLYRSNSQRQRNFGSVMASPTTKLDTLLYAKTRQLDMDATNAALKQSFSVERKLSDPRNADSSAARYKKRKWTGSSDGNQLAGTKPPHYSNAPVLETYQPRKDHTRSQSTPIASQHIRNRAPPTRHIRTHTTTLPFRTPPPTPPQCTQHFAEISWTPQQASYKQLEHVQLDPLESPPNFRPRAKSQPSKAVQHRRAASPPPLKLFPSSPTNSSTSSKRSNSSATETSIYSPTRSFRSSLFLSQKSVFEDDEDDKASLMDIFKRSRKASKRRKTSQASSIKTMSEWKWKSLLCVQIDDDEE